MSISLIKPLQLAVIIQYSLIFRDPHTGHDPRSLASYFFKSMELKTKAQHLPNHILIEDDHEISSFDKALYLEVYQNDFFDVDLYKSKNFDLLARLLYTANFQSYSGRYGDESTDNMNLNLLIDFVKDKKKEAYNYAKNMNYLEFIKLLDQLNMNCGEMDGYDKSLCKLFIDIVIYHTIRTQLDYYQAPFEIV